MKKIFNKTYTGERALFKSSNLEIDNCVFKDGESHLKESKNLNISNSSFEWKYPLWYCNNVLLKNSVLKDTARSGIWYTNDITLENVDIIAPKQFRRASNVTISNSNFTDAKETLWNCKNIKLSNVKIVGDYFGLDSENIEAYNIEIEGNYCFDGVKNIKIYDSVLNSKDSFWNCENVYIENTRIVGEYLAWNSKNVTIKDCYLESEQGLCYIDTLVLENVEMNNSNLIFEYCSNITANVKGNIDSIKNPISGHIKATNVSEVILKEDDLDFSKVKIEIV